MNNHTIVIGSRGSALALQQTGWVKEKLLSGLSDAEISIKIISTSADRDQSASIRAGSSIGVFVKEIEQALLSREIDIAVHSMKDLPTTIAPGLRIAAVPTREDVRDALITRTATGPRGLDGLPVGARIGTGSVRRQAQLLALRPDLHVIDIRGNVDTRLKRLADGAYDAIILACAGLNRLGLQNRISSILELHQMLPAPGQGALAIEMRADDLHAESVAAALNDPIAGLAVSAERAFLRRAGGGCNVPVAVHARVNDAAMEIEGLIVSPDGKTSVREKLHTPAESGDKASETLAESILSHGGREILDRM